MAQSVMELVLASTVGLEPEEFALGDEVQTLQEDSLLPRRDAPLVGVLCGLSEQGTPLVRFAGDQGVPLPARSIVPLDSGAVGREVVLIFEGGHAARPIIMGALNPPRPEPIRTEIDGEELVFTAKREIVLRCGKSSITLTRAGKILICGEYLLSRSAGVNRIKGGSVQIN